MASVVHSDPQIMSGMVVFRGTRVPVKTLFDYLEHGHSLDQFLISRPQLEAEILADGPCPQRIVGIGRQKEIAIFGHERRQ